MLSLSPTEPEEAIGSNGGPLEKKKWPYGLQATVLHVTCCGQTYLQFLTSVFNVKAYTSVWDVGEGSQGDSESLSSSRLGLRDSVCSVKHG